MSSENCTDTLPVSEDYFDDIPTAEKALIGVAGGLTFIAIVLYLEQVVYIIKFYPAVTRWETCFISGLYPVFMIMGLMALCVPRSAVFDDLVAFVYFSVTMHLFMNLIILYYGGTEKLLDTMKDTKAPLRVPPCCCCCCCCPSVPISRKNLLRLRLLVLQVALIRPLLQIISVILWTDNKFRVGDFTSASAYPFTSIMSGVSTLFAMYGLIIMMRVARGHFPGAMLPGKFAGLQLVLVISNLQSFIFTILARYNIPACTAVLNSAHHARVYHYLLLVFEMFLLALLSRYVYRRPQTYPAEKGGETSDMKVSLPEEVGTDCACVAENGTVEVVNNENSDVITDTKIRVHTNDAFVSESIWL